jgi:hypothetical protein
MKISILKSMLLIAIAAFMLNSCSSTKQIPKFSSVESLYQVKLNSSLEDVITIMGMKPYNVLSSQIDGYTLYTFKYKMVERKVSKKLINDKGGETMGVEKYNGKMQTAFMFFKANKLEAYITTEGRVDSPLMIVLNNTVYTISQDKGQYICVPCLYNHNCGDKNNKKCSKFKKCKE